MVQFSLWCCTCIVVCFFSVVSTYQATGKFILHQLKLSFERKKPNAISPELWDALSFWCLFRSGSDPQAVRYTWLPRLYSNEFYPVSVHPIAVGTGSLSIFLKLICRNKIDHIPTGVPQASFIACTCSYVAINDGNHKKLLSQIC